MASETGLPVRAALSFFFVASETGLPVRASLIFFFVASESGLPVRASLIFFFVASESGLPVRASLIFFFAASVCFSRFFGMMVSSLLGFRECALLLVLRWVVPSGSNGGRV
ncbi:hypothetical protein [Streptomyces flaveolus]|uniref:hypothetical protein n=1 Tax=Streptomyces flaveolus TaxID=67297 RepID=UPI003F4D9359